MLGRCAAAHQALCVNPRGQVFLFWTISEWVEWAKLSLPSQQVILAAMVRKR